MPRYESQHIKNRIVFKTSTAWVSPQSTSRIYLTLVGGGGGGGGVVQFSPLRYGSGGTGGGAVCRYPLIIPANTSITITIGAGGAGGSSAAGGGGGNTVFGNYITAIGGPGAGSVSGGTGGVAVLNAFPITAIDLVRYQLAIDPDNVTTLCGGGFGGTGGLSNTNPGVAGAGITPHNGGTVNAVSGGGGGGASAFGDGGAGSNGSTAGFNATGYGAGGGGGITGGNGASGLCIIEFE